MFSICKQPWLRKSLCENTLLASWSSVKQWHLCNMAVIDWRAVPKLNHRDFVPLLLPPDTLREMTVMFATWITTWNQSKVLNVQRDGARVRHSQDAQQRGDSRPTQHSHGSLCAHWQLRWLHQDCLALVPAVPSPCIGHWSALVSSHCRWLRREKQNPQSSLKFLNACFDKMALLMQKWPVDFWAQHTCPYHCWHPWSIDPYAGLDTFTWGQLC